MFGERIGYAGENAREAERKRRKEGKGRVVINTKGRCGIQIPI